VLNLPKDSLLPYFTAGWPTPEAFVEAVCGAARAGCPAFEVGIPFTDPVADGPVIQQTSSAALAAGIGWHRAVELTGEAVRRSGLSAIAMTYCNPLYAVGLDSAMGQLARAGVRGVIVPDLTIEEGEPFEAAAVAAGLDLIYLVAPTTPEERVAELAGRSRGFLYMVSVRGVTGARQELASDLESQIARVVARSTIPVLVGFGISTPEQAAHVGRHCHGVIVGSALLRALQAVAPEQAGPATEQFLAAMRRAMLSAPAK
jgi:tryptophan synthase alpha chain